MTKHGLKDRNGMMYGRRLSYRENMTSLPSNMLPTTILIPKTVHTEIVRQAILTNWAEGVQTSSRTATATSISAILKTGAYWNPGWYPSKTDIEEYSCTHGIGYTKISAKKDGIKASITGFVGTKLPAEQWKIEIENTDKSEREIKVYSFVEFSLEGYVTIAYLGGSITQQESWRPKTTQWFKDKFKNCNITEVNIGLSGTNADLAVCRIDKDTLTYNPDLVFIEYAVNGGAAKDMEGMLLKIWEHDPTTDVMSVYTTETKYYQSYKSENLPQYPAIYEPPVC